MTAPVLFFDVFSEKIPHLNAVENIYTVMLTGFLHEIFNIISKITHSRNA